MSDDVRLILGDCLQHLPALAAGSVDAVIADPPYGMAFQSKRFATIANDQAPFVWWLPHAFTLVKEGGCLLCFCRWDSAEAFRLAIQWAGFRVASQLIWDRVIHGMGDLQGQPGPQHDTIWFATKGRYAFAGRRPTTVLRCPRPPGCELEHPNQKPTALLAELIRSYTAPGELVCDPTMGSGSTGVACVQTGRRFLGIELDPGYFALAERRITACQGAGGLFDPAALAASQP